LDATSEKGRLLEDFLKRTISPKTIQAVKSLLDKKRTLDWESLLGFFSLLGPPAVGLAAGLHEIAPDGEARHRVLGFIEAAGASDPKLLVDIVAHERPGLAREIIGMLARAPEKRGVPHLSVFLTFPDKEIKLEAIHTLGGLRDEVANRILLGFLKDPDEEVRIQAALKLDPSEAGARVRQIVREAGTKGFRAKSLKEKEALLSFLGRTRTDEALEFLRATMLRAGFFAGQAALETRLAAVAGLAVMGTAGASEALQKGAIGRTRKVREACRQALESLPPAGRTGA
jgi:HEAT repeat protein